MTRTPLLTVLAVLLITASSAPAATATTGGADTTASQTDLADDTIGWEGGYWHNDSISVTYDDGLNDTELDKVVARSMARVEYLRKAEFTENVSARVISREQYRENNPMSTGGDSEFNAWNNQVWEALFMVGENTDANDKLNAMYSGTVLGYYQSGNVVLVTRGGDNPKLPEATLVHELSHALQDQRFNLSKAKYNGQVQDTQLGTNGLVEGEAKYIEKRFIERCNSGDWECYNPSNSRQGSSQTNIGMQVTVFQPYSDGPVYVDHLVKQGGWSAVDAAWENPPQTSTEIIHPGERRAVNVTLADPRDGDWTAISLSSGRNGSDSVGEASVYTMFWYQSYRHGVDVVPRNNLQKTQNPYDTYNYNHAVSAGLAGDTLRPYDNPEAPENGYVWKTVWDTPADATEFVNGYQKILSAHGATENTTPDTQGTLWTVQDGEFADAFIVAQVNNTVYIANGPTENAAREMLPDTLTATDISTATQDETNETDNKSLPRAALPPENTTTPPDDGVTSWYSELSPTNSAAIYVALFGLIGFVFVFINWLTGH